MFTAISCVCYMLRTSRSTGASRPRARHPRACHHPAPHRQLTRRRRSCAAFSIESRRRTSHDRQFANFTNSRNGTLRSSRASTVHCRILDRYSNGALLLTSYIKRALANHAAEDHDASATRTPVEVDARLAELKAKFTRDGESTSKRRSLSAAESVRQRLAEMRGGETPAD